jgi:hypothetical protein
MLPNEVQAENKFGHGHPNVDPGLDRVKPALWLEGNGQRRGMLEKESGGLVLNDERYCFFLFQFPMWTMCEALLQQLPLPGIQLQTRT